MQSHSELKEGNAIMLYDKQTIATAKRTWLGTPNAERNVQSSGIGTCCGYKKRLVNLQKMFAGYYQFGRAVECSVLSANYRTRRVREFLWSIGPQTSAISGLTEETEQLRARVTEREKTIASARFTFVNIQGTNGLRLPRNVWLRLRQR